MALGYHYHIRRILRGNRCFPHYIYCRAGVKYMYSGDSITPITNVPTVELVQDSYKVHISVKVYFKYICTYMQTCDSCTWDVRMTIVCHSLSLCCIRGHAGICSQCVDTSRNKGVWVWSYCTDKPSNIKESALSSILTTRSPKRLDNKISNQPTTDNRQVASADQDTHYKRPQSTSWLDSRLQEVARRPQSEALEPVWSGSSFYWQDS